MSSSSFPIEINNMSLMTYGAVGLTSIILAIITIYDQDSGEKPIESVAPIPEPSPSFFSAPVPEPVVEEQEPIIEEEQEPVIEEEQEPVMEEPEPIIEEEQEEEQQENTIGGKKRSKQTKKHTKKPKKTKQTKYNR